MATRNATVCSALVEKAFNGGRAKEIGSFYCRIERDEQGAVTPPPEPKIVMNQRTRDSQDSGSQSSGPGTGDEERNPKSLSLGHRQKLEAKILAALRRLASTEWREQGCVMFGR